MLVPLMSDNPPPRAADRTSTPGPPTFAPTLENGAIVYRPELKPSAATEMTSSDAAGGEAEIRKSGSTSVRLSLPAAATMIVG